MTTTEAPPAAQSVDAAPPSGAQNPAAGMYSSDSARTMYALLAAGLGIIPLNALLRESGWLFDAWLAMFIVVGPAALLRLRRPASTLQIWLGVVLLVPYLTARFVHQHAVAGFIPGPGTWHDVHVLLIGLHHTTTSGVAPVHTTNAIRLVLCVILPLITALIDMVAVVGRRGALAGIPLLVIYTVSGAVPRHPVRWPLFVFAAIAFLILLALDSRDDVQRWGHFVPRTGLARRRASGAISAQRIAVIGVALAILIPAFVQANSQNLLANAFHDGKKNGTGGEGLGAGGTAGIDPFVTLRGDLTRNSPVDLLNVHIQRLDERTDTVQPFYARANVLSTYSNTRGWTVGTHGVLDDLLTTGFQSAPGTNYAPITAEFRAEITIDKLVSDPPVFVQPRSIDGDVTQATHWSRQDQLLIGGSTHGSEKYQVTFQQPDPSIGDLDAANTLEPAMQPWLQLPAIAPSVQTLVTSLTADAATQYAKAAAIDHYFTDPANGFGYNLHVPDGPTSDALVNFLRNKVGFCQQYAGAMAVMLRMAGVPARVVLGYTHRAPDSDGYFSITTNDAHAWVEAYFAGIGWIPFDPTPLTGITDGTKNDLVWAPHSIPNSGSSSTAPAVPSATKPKNGISDSKGPNGSATRSHNTGIGTAAPVLAGVVLLVLLGASAPWLQRSSRRRRRLRHARHGDADALWTELSDTATDLGFVWSPARSPRQVVEWLRREAGTAEPELTALAAAVERARYAPSGHTDVDGASLVQDYQRLQTQLTANQEPRARLRARLLPASLGWTTNAGQRIAHLPGLRALPIIKSFGQRRQH